jgi:hypothetical protein
LPFVTYRCRHDTSGVHPYFSPHSAAGRGGRAGDAAAPQVVLELFVGVLEER